MELFGYGEPTGIDLPGEVAAQVPTDQWKRQLFAETWTTGDSYNMAIGQGYVLATPLQVLLETMAVANGGTIYEPRVVHHMTDANGGVQKDFEPVVARKLPIQCGELGYVRQGMWEVMNADYGTGYAARVPGVEMARQDGHSRVLRVSPGEAGLPP